MVQLIGNHEENFHHGCGCRNTGRKATRCAQNVFALPPMEEFGKDGGSDVRGARPLPFTKGGTAV